jgi:RNase P protein component
LKKSVDKREKIKIVENSIINLKKKDLVVVVNSKVNDVDENDVEDDLILKCNVKSRVYHDELAIKISETEVDFQNLYKL